MPLQLERQPRWYRRPAHPGESFDLLHIRDWHDSRNDGDGNPSRTSPFYEIEIEDVIEEQLGDREIKAGIDLSLEMFEIDVASRTLEMPFGITRSANAQTRLDLPNHLDEIDRKLHVLRWCRSRLLVAT